MKDRTTSTIDSLVKKYIAPGSVVNCDGWRAYHNINWNEYNLQWVRNIKKT